MEPQLADILLRQDEALLVVNKPAGLLTLPDGYDPNLPCLVEMLKTRFNPLWVVHRLDKDTSGVIVFARTAQAHRDLNAQFAGRAVRKSYHALVWGAPPWQSQQIKLALRPNGDRKHRTVIDLPGGKKSMTDVTVLERYRSCALVEAQPHTGRRHQIRAHLAAQGYPILNDALYGDERPLLLSALKADYRTGRTAESPLLGRLGLHAWALTFVHPSGERMQFQAPYPQDFHRAVKNLRKYSLQGGSVSAK